MKYIKTFEEVTYDQAVSSGKIGNKIKDYINKHYPEYSNKDNNILGRYGHSLSKSSIAKITKLATSKKDEKLKELLDEFKSKSIKEEFNFQDEEIYRKQFCEKWEIDESELTTRTYSVDKSEPCTLIEFLNDNAEALGYDNIMEYCDEDTIVKDVLMLKVGESYPELDEYNIAQVTRLT